MSKILKVTLLTITLMSTINLAHADAGKKTYKQVCFVCHDSGASGAPILGDKVAWKSRIARGKTALYSSAMKGVGLMPPKGGKSTLTDEQIKAVVDYMISQAN